MKLDSHEFQVNRIYLFTDKLYNENMYGVDIKETTTPLG